MACPYVEHVCGWVREPKACSEAVAARVASMSRTPGEVVFDGALVETNEATAALGIELAFAAMWRPLAPVVLEVALGSHFPLSYASAGPLPEGSRACVALYSSTRGMFGNHSRGAFVGSSFELMCEREREEQAAARLHSDDDPTLASLELPFVLGKVAFHKPGRVEVMVFVRTPAGLLGGGQNYGARSCMSLRVLPATSTFARPRATSFTRPSSSSASSSLTVVEVPAVPYASRHSVLERVAYSNQTLYFFDNDDDTPLSSRSSSSPSSSSSSSRQQPFPAPPRVLGRLRSGAVVGSWRRVVVRHESYAEFAAAHCDERIRTVVAARHIQSPESQFHFLFTAMTQLQQLVAGLAEPALVLYDDFTDTRRMIDTPNEGSLLQRAARQHQEILGVSARLWDEYMSRRGTTCIERLFVNADERDSFLATMTATGGAVWPRPVEHAPEASQFARSRRALAALRDALREHFAPPRAKERYARALSNDRSGAPPRVVLIERRTSRRIADHAAALAAATETCNALQPSQARPCTVESVALEDYSYEDQIELLADTDLLVGVEGQGLSNMIYLRERASVVILAPPGHERAAVDYATIGTLLNLRVATSLEGLTNTTRIGLNRRADYWSASNDLLEIAPELVGRLVRDALLDQRAHRAEEAAATRRQSGPGTAGDLEHKFIAER